MISNQILQNTIEGLKGISRVDFCVLDTEGKELAATFESGQDRSEAVLSFVESPADSQVIQGCQFFKIFDEQRLEYVLLADGDSEDVYMLGKIAAFQIQSLLVAYKERFDKDNFIKNLLLDNLLLVDIYNRAKKLHIDTEAKRVIFIIETSHEKDNAALENVRSLLGGRSKEFITAVDEKNIIVVKELTDKESGRELERWRRKCWIRSTARERKSGSALHTEPLSMISRKFPSLIRKQNLPLMWGRSFSMRKIS